MGDAGTLSVAAQDTITGSGVQTFTGAKTFNHQKFKLRNPADTFSLTFNNPVIGSNLSGEYMDSFDYLLHKDGSNYVAKRDNWSVESSNSDPNVVLAYAITNASLKGAIGLKGGRGNWFTFTSKINVIDKDVTLIGVNASGEPGGVTESTAYGGVVFKKNYATAEPFFDATNTGYHKLQLQNITLYGNATGGDIGIKAHDIRERTPLFDNVTVTNFDTGVELSKAVYTSIRDLNIFSCATTGLSLTSTSATNNTLEVYGGRIVASPTNLKINTSSANDVKFFGTVIEGKQTGHTRCVDIDNGSNNVGFYGCSFEKNTETTPIVVDDDGNNNTYFNCRFDSDVSYTPILIGANGRNINVIACFFQTNTAATTQTITITSGAVGTHLIDNTKSTNTVGTVTLSDSGTLTTRLGNSQMGINDRVPSGLELGANGLRFIESDANTLLLRDTTNASYKSLFLNALGCSAIRTTTSVDNITIGSTVTAYSLASEENVVTAPTDPAANKIRRYPKQVDANNDGYFVKRKVNGAVVEVQL